MLSRSQQKLLRKLSSKKYRYQYRMFLAEGRKVVSELLDEGVKLEFLMALPSSGFASKGVEVSEAELKKWSSLEVADEVIAVFHFPEVPQAEEGITLVLDGIKDPGNLGTILRTSDWFGISRIYCSTGTVDIFNPKTVQSTMGSIGRVRVEYLSNEHIYDRLHSGGYELLCADMEGEPFQTLQSGGRTAIVMGSESHGPSDFWKNHARGITIPRKGNSRAESLNVAVATAIILGQLSRL